MGFGEMPTRPKSEFKDVKIEGIVKRALEAAQSEGEKALPKLIQAIADAQAVKNPVAIERLNPDSQRNQEHLSESARNALRKAWETSESK